MMQTVRSRIPLKFWFIIMILFVTVAILATLHFAGIFDLSFIGVAFLGTYMWASVDIMSGIILLVIIALPFTFLGFALQKYVFGHKITTGALTNTGQSVYTPANAPIPTVKPQVVEG